MALSITGPDVGDSLAHITILSHNGESITLADLPHERLVVNVFRGNW